jgi:hypothetical protein
MILTTDALEVIAYLKTAPGKFFSMQEICRRAAGRRRFEESPGWARNLMSHLVEAGFVEVNSRGHYRVRGSSSQPKAPEKSASHATHKPRGKVVGDNYFPPSSQPQIVGGDYFPTNE